MLDFKISIWGLCIYKGLLEIWRKKISSHFFSGGSQYNLLRQWLKMIGLSDLPINYPVIILLPETEFKNSKDFRDHLNLLSYLMNEEDQVQRRYLTKITEY